jgi:hypothetical protein
MQKFVSEIRIFLYVHICRQYKDIHMAEVCIYDDSYDDV